MVVVKEISGAQMASTPQHVAVLDGATFMGHGTAGPYEGVGTLTEG